MAEHKATEGDKPIDPRRCRESVWSSVYSHRYQCKSTAVVDNRWCRQHDPKAVKARQEKSAKARQAKRNDRPQARLYRLVDRVQRVLDGSKCSCSCAAEIRAAIADWGFKKGN
jgi:hypothetical protein